MASRALVIGLDGAPPELVFARWRDELPVLRGLMEQGTYGVLRSCDPSITVPAWTSMTSSRSPGTLGIYGFRNRRSRLYDDLVLTDSRAVRVPRVWDLLSAQGRDVIVLGVPQTYPVNEVNGVMVACFLTPNPRTSPYTYPPQLRNEIQDLVGDYMPDVVDFRTDDKDGLRAEIEDVTEKRFRVAEHLLETRPWDPSSWSKWGPIGCSTDSGASSIRRTASTRPATGLSRSRSTTTGRSTRRSGVFSASPTTTRRCSSSPTTARSGWSQRRGPRVPGRRWARGLRNRARRAQDEARGPV